MKKTSGFSFNTARCIKCYSCEIACKQWKGIKADTIKLRRVVEVTTGVFPDVKRDFYSLSCRHCAKAPCMAACPENAISRTDEGIVLVDREKCIGCRACFDACPFGVPQFDEDGIMQKCDMCLDRLKDGKKPACAAACPTAALQWGTLEDLGVGKAIRSI